MLSLVKRREHEDTGPEPVLPQFVSADLVGVQIISNVMEQLRKRA